MKIPPGTLFAVLLGGAFAGLRVPCMAAEPAEVVRDPEIQEVLSAVLQPLWRRATPQETAHLSAVTGQVLLDVYVPTKPAAPADTTFVALRVTTSEATEEYFRRTFSRKSADEFCKETGSKNLGVVWRYGWFDRTTATYWCLSQVRTEKGGTLRGARLWTSDSRRLVIVESVIEDGEGAPTDAAYLPSLERFTQELARRRRPAEIP